MYGSIIYPEVRATLRQVKDAERQLGFEFPEDYKDFLLHANGWNCFYQYVDVLPLHDLLNASDIHRSIMYNVEFMLKYEPAEGQWLDQKNLLPVATDTHNVDTFVLIIPGNPNAGTAVWLSGDEIDRFPSFHEFYMSMLDYNRLEVKTLKEELEAGEG